MSCTHPLTSTLLTPFEMTLNTDGEPKFLIHHQLANPIPIKHNAMTRGGLGHFGYLRRCENKFFPIQFRIDVTRRVAIGDGLTYTAGLRQPGSLSTAGEAMDKETGLPGGSEVGGGDGGRIDSADHL